MQKKVIKKIFSFYYEIKTLLEVILRQNKYVRLRKKLHSKNDSKALMDKDSINSLKNNGKDIKMVHTAQFYLMLKEEDEYLLMDKYGELLSLISTKINDKYKDRGITTTFKKSYKIWFMFVTIDFIKLLNKSDISEIDYDEIKRKINNYLFDIFEDNKRDLILIRIDYRLDVKIESKEKRKLLLNLYKKTAKKHRFKQKFDKFETNIYFNSESMKCTIYDKETERKDKKVEIEKYEKYILRYEVRVLNRHLNYNQKKYGIEKTLKSYFKDAMFFKYKKELEMILYTGNYYKIYKAEKIIDESSFSEKEKISLRGFLVDISLRTISDVMRIEKDGKLKYSKYKFNKYIKMLNTLTINPILIPKNTKGISFLSNPINS